MPIVSEKYAIALQRMSVNLPVSLVANLLDLVAELKDAGKVRTFENEDLYSVFDFIGNVLQKGGERKVWERLTKEHPAVVTICHYCQFPGARQRQTPVTSLLGLLYIAYLLPGELGDGLRKASAELVIETVQAFKLSFDNLFNDSQNVRTSASDERIVELEWKAAEYDRLLFQTDATIFQNNLKAVKQVSGIRQYPHLIKMLKQSFVEGIDYHVEYGEYILNNPTYNSIIAACRSEDGVDTTKLPNMALLLWDNYARLTKKLRNTWMPKRRKRSPHRQLSLFDE